jgi:pterin-4a-carbinolamine dehydratase/uncharacterized protein (DUF2267 family)
MSGKQMEGDNKRRRTEARRAREEGRAPSEKGVTLGASKQREREAQARRTGPPPAGAHKPTAQDPVEGRPAQPSPQLPRPNPVETGDGEAGVQYRELVAAASRETGVPFDQGRLASEAAVTVLARALAPADRERFMAAVPAELHDDYQTTVQPVDLVDFLNQIATITHETPEQARRQAQAVFAVLREQDPTLVDSLTLPPYLTDLMAPTPVGGGIVGPDGGLAPLSADELREALGRLPRWSGDQRALVRSISLPPGNLERVLQRLADLKRELGRGPKISRDGEDSATLTVRTTRLEAVTAPDIDLAQRIDAAIDEAGGGVNAG